MLRRSVAVACAALLAACCDSGGGGSGSSKGLVSWLTGCGGVAGSSSQAVQLIETSDAGDATHPQVGFDGGGNALAVWQQSDGVRQNIWANRYTAGGGWGTAQAIEISNLGDATNPQVAVDAAGNAVAVWQQSDGVRDNIWANRYTAGGGWGTAELIESNNAGAAGDPRVAVDAAGNALAVWQQSDGLRDNIWFNRYTAGGGWGTAALIESDNAGAATNARIAVDTAGNALAVWQQSDGTRNNIWANRYTTSGGWGNAELIEAIAGEAADPRVAVDGAGNALAVWQQSDGVRNNIWANRYSAGSGWNNAELIEGSAGDAANPRLGIDGAGNALAVWQQSDGVRDNIWANRYTAGSGWGTAALIESDNAGDAVNPQVAVDSAGDAWAVWQQSDGTRNNIRAARYTNGGWSGPVIVETSNAGDALMPQVAVDAGGNGLAVWYQSDGVRYNIEATTLQ